MSRGELYTMITGRNNGQGNGCLIACIRGAKADDIIKWASEIPEESRKKVKEITMDMAPSMKLAALRLFPDAVIVTDRFHVVRLVMEAVQSIRIAYRKKAIDEENEEIAKCRKSKTPYKPELCENQETKKELLARSRFIFYKYPTRVMKSQWERAVVLFKRYPNLKKAYNLACQFRNVYQAKTLLGAKIALKRWLDKVKNSGLEEFNTVANSIANHRETILNFFKDRSTNASAESFNAKIKLFRANLRGVTDAEFFLFRLEKLFA